MSFVGGSPVFIGQYLFKLSSHSIVKVRMCDAFHYNNKPGFREQE